MGLSWLVNGVRLVVSCLMQFDWIHCFFFVLFVVAGVTGPFIVVEGQPLRLRCSAIGHPTPHVEWLRTDNRPIPDGAWVGESRSRIYSKSFHPVENKMKTSNIYSKFGSIVDARSRAEYPDCEPCAHGRLSMRSCKWHSTNSKCNSFHWSALWVNGLYIYGLGQRGINSTAMRPLQISSGVGFLSFLLVPFSCALDSSTESTFIHSWRIVGDARVWGKIIYFHFTNETCRSAAVVILGNRRQTNRRCAELIENWNEIPNDARHTYSLPCDYWKLNVVALSAFQNSDWLKSAGGQRKSGNIRNISSA